MLIIFVTNVTEKVRNQKVLYFPTSRSCFTAYALPGEHETRKLRLFT